MANPEIDVLIAKARGMLPDDPQRLTVLRQIGRLGVEYAANMPLMTRSNVYAYRPAASSG